MFDNGNDTDNLKPSFEERYEAATNTSDLSHEAEKRGASDVLRDMAMSASRLGGALMRLRSQWESSTKPERQVPRTVKQMLALLGDKDKAIAAHLEERARCDASYENALNALAQRIDGLDAVREELTPVAMRWGFGIPADPITRAERREKLDLDDQLLVDLRATADAALDDAGKMTAQAELNAWTIEVRRQRAQEELEDRRRAQMKVSAVIRYWLSQACPKCDGLKFLVAPGTGRLSTKICPPSQGGCGGTGFVSCPHGQEGRRLANHMDQCVHRHKQASKARQRMEALPLAELVPLALRNAMLASKSQEKDERD